MENLFFNNWDRIWRTLIIGVLAYVALVFILRISGKRTLSKMNAFDFIVTIALGSTLATILLSKDTALAEGIVALSLLVFLQFIITWLSVRSKKFQQLIKSTPALLFYRGSFLQHELKKERITQEEINAKLRQKGIEDVRTVDAVVLETDGTLSVIPEIRKETGLSSLNNVINPLEEGKGVHKKNSGT